MTNNTYEMGDRVRVLSTNGIGSVCEVLDDTNIIIEYDAEYEYISPVDRLEHTTINDVERITREAKMEGKVAWSYQSKLDISIQYPVLAEYKYIGKTDELEFVNGKIYDCIGYEDNMARIIDETGEDYLYNLDNFKLVKEFEIDKSLFFTEGHRVIHYFNEHRFNIKPIISINKIHNLDDLFKLLLKCYCKETAYPSCKNEYNSCYDPTYGQCAITAMIVNDIFGGTIHKINVKGGGTHYFNKIGDLYIDLTSDQFTLYEINVKYNENKEIPKEYCGKNADTAKRYELLKQKLYKLIEE